MGGGGRLNGLRGALLSLIFFFSFTPSLGFSFLSYSSPSLPSSHRVSWSFSFISSLSLSLHLTLLNLSLPKRKDAVLEQDEKSKMMEMND